MDEAKVAFDRLMEIYLDLTIANVKQAMVFNPAYLDRLAANLRRLSLPE